MGIKSAPYYWVECDGCGESSQLDSDYSAFGSKDEAIEQATDYAEWLDTTDGKYWCQSCTVCCHECGDEWIPKPATVCPVCAKAGE